MPFGDHFAVFIPEIEHVAYYKDHRSILLDFVEERDYLFLAQEAAICIRSAKMKVRKEVDLISGDHFIESFPGFFLPKKRTLLSGHAHLQQVSFLYLRYGLVL